MKMRELIYMWIDKVDNRANIEKQGIQFSNDYDIKITIKQDEIGVNRIFNISIEEKKNFFRNFYGQNITSISALVGVNGVGKTTVLNLLGSEREYRKKYKRKWSYFVLYRIDDRYVIEGNGLDVIKNFVEGSIDYADDEYSFFCEYLKKDNKLKLVEFCSEMGRVERSVKYLYLQDYSIDYRKIFNGGYLEMETDYFVCFERKELTYTLSNVYNIFFEIYGNKKYEKLVGMNNIRLNVELNTGIDTWCNSNTKKRFIVSMILSFLYFWKKWDYTDKKIEIDEEINVKEEILNMLPGVETGYYGKVFHYDDIMYEECIRVLKKDDTYNSHRKFLESKIALVEKFPNDIFNGFNDKSKSGFTICAEDKYLKEIYDFLGDVQPSCWTTSCDGLSAGEIKTLQVLAGIDNAINLATKDEDIETLILLMDEPDKGFHPEMARRFISILTDTINSLQNKCKYQIIMTTHSPFMISDIPAPYVHCFQKLIDGDKTRIEIKGSYFGLLNSIPDLMKNTFFLECPFGEFGNRYYQTLLKRIENWEWNEDEEELDRLNETIDTITDPILNKYLRKCLEEKIEKQEETDKIVRYYQKRIAELQKQNNNRN